MREATDFEEQDATDRIADDDGAILLQIPTSRQCAPTRSFIVGGVSRIRPGWSAVAEAGIGAAEASHWQGGSVRSVTRPSAVTFHRRSGSFQTISARTGRTVSGIGPYELANFEELEVDPVWIDFDLQGLEYTLGDGSTYLSDFHGRHATLGIVAGEVKSHPSYLTDPAYAPTMAAARTISHAVDITFHEITGSQLFGHARAERRFNVRRAFDDRFTTYRPHQENAVRDLLARSGEVAFSNVWSLLSNDPNVARQIANAMMCRRILKYDLDLPVRGDTVVTAPLEAEAGIDIRSIELNTPD